jgi:F420-non-reducing hydrogenase small subunit
MYWASSCGGCDIAVLNIHEKILEVDANFEVVFWPVAMDAKYKDVEAMQDGEILLTLFNGAIRTSENEHMANLLRRKSKLLVAFGSCASEGCMPALANLSSKKDLFDTVYGTLTTENPQNLRPQTSFQVPEGELTLPEFYSVVKTLDQVVPVDYYIPGCPPESHQIAAVIDAVIAVLQGKAELPPAGSVFGAGSFRQCCDECKRTRECQKMKRISIDPITRLEGTARSTSSWTKRAMWPTRILQIPELRGFEKVLRRAARPRTCRT